MSTDAKEPAEAEAASPPEGTGGVMRRGIRSFVLRQGRLTEAQQRALDEGLPRWGIAYAPRPLDLGTAFGRAAPKVLEIGFGMGETTATIAAANPERDYLGLEVHSPGVGGLLIRIATLRLTNLRVIQHDAVEVLTTMIAPASQDAVHVYFPDPWPKKRHHKRRLIQPPMVALIASRLKPGGVIHCATDWVEYAEQMLDVLGAEPLLDNTTSGYAPRPDSRPLTKFEQRGLRLGHVVHDLVFCRR